MAGVGAHNQLIVGAWPWWESTTNGVWGRGRGRGGVFYGVVLGGAIAGTRVGGVSWAAEKPMRCWG